MNTYWDKASRHTLTRRSALAAIGTTTAAAFLAACGGSQSKSSSRPAGDTNSAVTQPVDETKQVKRGGTYKTMIQFDLTTLDPHVSGNHVPVTPLAYSQLFRIKEGHMEDASGDLDGEILQSWEMSPDKLTLTGKINKQASFHNLPPVNGRPVTAADVVFSWERFKQMGTRRADLSNQYSPDAPVVSLTASDDDTIVIKLNKPNATILSSFTVVAPGGYHIVPKEAADTNVLDLRNTQLGSGPWMATKITPSVGIFYKKHQSFKIDSRDVPYADGMDMPTITEYATQMAQFRAGNLYGSQAGDFFPVKAEDVLQTKKDLPDLSMVQTSPLGTNTRFFFGQLPESPFKDARVRQAWMYTIDRDLFIDTAYNVPAFRKEGLPVTTTWDSGLSAQVWRGWWMDPRNKDFGPNAKYTKVDLTEAKRLLSAAGFNSAVDAPVHFPPTGIPTQFYQHYPILVGMARDSGLFKVTMDPVDYNVAWTPQYRNIKGKFVGVGTWSPATGYPDPTNELFAVYHSSGALYQGGDSTMDDLLNKAIAEFDTAKRQSLVWDVQRHEAESSFYPKPGGASGLGLTWPIMRNVFVWRGGTGRIASTIFLDPDKPPNKRG